MDLIFINAKNWVLMRKFLLLICVLFGNVYLQSAMADSMELEKLERLVENESSEHKSNGIKLFFPTHEWQTIEPDAIIFAGLHYRINIATGLKEAKLMDESDGFEYYQLLEKWIQDRQPGNTLPSDIEGGFKITQKFQTAQKLFFESLNNKKEKESSTISDENTKIYDSGKIDGSGSSKYSLIEVPLLELEQHENSKSLASQDEQQKKSFIEDLIKLDDSHASFDETINQLLKSSAHELQDSDHKSSAEAPSKFRTYEQLKQELADIELLIDDEQHIMQTLIKEHQNLTTESQLIQSVEDIEYLLHNIDNAQVFIDYDGLHRVVLPALNSSSPVLCALACQLVTACVQNFPKGQIAAFEAGLLPRLLDMLQSDQTPAVHGRALSSVSGMVRQFPLAQTELIRIGLPVLRSLLRQPEHTLKAKVIALLADLLLERLSDSDTSEREQQLTVVGLESALLDLDWCHHLTENLRQTADTMPGEGDQNREGFLDTLLHALQASVSLCPVEFRSLLSSLQHLEMIFRKEAETVTSSDKAELYLDTANSILGLMGTFVADNSKAKQEL